MRRRDLLAGLLATATTALRAAEPNRVYRLAVCPIHEDPGIKFVLTSFFARLQQLGYIEWTDMMMPVVGLNAIQRLHATSCKEGQTLSPLA